MEEKLFVNIVRKNYVDLKLKIKKKMLNDTAFALAKLKQVR